LKKVALIAFSILLVLGISSAFANKEIVHTVKKGDTLWGISNKYLNTPFKWPLIWARNKDITNPHLIYPEDRVVIRWEGKKVKIKIIPKKEGKKVKTITLEKETKKQGKTVCVSPEYSKLIYSTSPIEGTGKVIENRDEIEDLATLNDTVMLKMHKVVNPGRRLAIISKEAVIKDKANLYGYLYRVAAFAKVVSYAEGKGTCKIVSSLKEVKEGDFSYDLKELKPLTLVLSRPHISGVGHVVYTLDHPVEIGILDVVFIDMGHKQGLKGGSLIGMYKNNLSYASGSSMPYQGMLLVLKSLDNTSMCLVIETKAPIMKNVLIGELK